MTDSGTSTLEPALTRWDKRVLAGLAVWPDTLDLKVPLEWRDLWQIGGHLKEEELPAVRRTLDGLERLNYVSARHWGHRRQWIATPWRRNDIHESTGEADSSGS